MRTADVLDPATLAPALERVDVAYYLVHSMGRGAGADFAARDRAGAENFAAAAEAAGVKRIVYLGGLGERVRASRQPPRHRTDAAVGQRSRSPTSAPRRWSAPAASPSALSSTSSAACRSMVTPKLGHDPAPSRSGSTTRSPTWRRLRSSSAPLDREIEIGGPDVTTYGGMIDELARAMGRRPPLRIVVPVLTPYLSSLWIGLVTPVDAGVARPLIEGLATETVVTDPSAMALFGIEPMPLATALRAALASTR